MKQLFLIVLIISSFASLTQGQEPTSSDQTSLFERLGGTEGISAIIDGAVGEHMVNPVIKERFTPYLENPERLAVIRQHSIDFISAGAGGEISYLGRDMPTTHNGMNISPAEYMAVIDDFMLVLDRQGIDEESKKDVLAIMWSLKGMIIAQ